MTAASAAFYEERIASLQGHLVEAARVLALHGHKIEAIKTYRAATGQGLLESNRWTESLPVLGNIDDMRIQRLEDRVTILERRQFAKAEMERRS